MYSDTLKQLINNIGEDTIKQNLSRNIGTISMDLLNAAQPQTANQIKLNIFNTHDIDDDFDIEKIQETILNTNDS